MAINVTPIPGLSHEINDIRRRTADLINTEILPHEEVLWRSRRHSGQSEGEPRRPAALADLHQQRVLALAQRQRQLAVAQVAGARVSRCASR